MTMLLLLASAALLVPARGDASFAWAANMGGPAGYSAQGSLGAGSKTTYTANLPQFPASALPATLYGEFVVTVTNPGGNGVTTACITVTSSGGGCNLHVCNGNPVSCTDSMPWSSSSQGSYSVTLSNGNWMFGGEGDTHGERQQQRATLAVGVLGT
jgi:hypothetical protein